MFTCFIYFDIIKEINAEDINVSHFLPGARKKTKYEINKLET